MTFILYPVALLVIGGWVGIFALIRPPKLPVPVQRLRERRMNRSHK